MKQQPKKIDKKTSRIVRSAAGVSYKDTATRAVPVSGVDFVYRQLGPEGGVPLVLLNHLAAGLDNWDP